MPTTITRPAARASRLGYGRAALALPVSRLSVVVADTPIDAAGSHVAADPLAELADELQRIHAAPDADGTYVFPA